MAITTWVTTGIRKLIGIFLVCVFALGITPVVYLHALVADHTDVVYGHSSSKETQVSKAGIICHYDSFVAEARFLPTFAAFTFEISSVFIEQFKPLFLENFYSRHHFFAELRGPPFLPVFIF